MRIRAIRGANLASLEGEFALELAEDPLGRAGVFAICGPTGAGKTTLLDAMCLALFDTAPRLDTSRRVRVGAAADDERLTTRDPRTILRKGAGSGYAEVDFEGVDGRAYRARWEVRRARERADGKIQASAMSLSDLESESRWAGRKTDVKVEIESRLGLSFDQFRRSVLLAQGDFAAFLDADPRERADLLERMTGTAIYGVISQEAHARAGEEARKLEALGERLRAVPELSEPEREELQQQAQSLAIELRAAELKVSDATAALRWHHELDGLKREEAEAREEQQNTLRQLALAETERQELAAWEAALPVRPHIDAALGGEALVEKRERELEEAKAAAKRARAAVERATEAATAAATALEGASVDRERSREQVEQARALDRAIEERAAAHQAATAELAEAEAAAERAEQAHARLVAEAEQAREEAARAAEWLEAHPEGAALEADWSRAREHLDRLIDLAERRVELASRCEEQDAALERAREQLAIREGGWRGLALRLAEARADHEALEAEVAAEPSAALGEERGAWVARRTALETLIGVGDRAQQAHAAWRRHASRAEAAAQRATEADRRAASARADRGGALAKLEEAQAQRDRVRATLDLAERRADLAEGEPCPLCGSVDHPYAHEAPVVSALLAAADERARELRERLSAIDAAIAEATQEAESERAAAASATEEAQSWSAELAELREGYRRAARELDGPWPDELPEEPEPVTSSGADWGPLFAVVSAPGGGGDGALLTEAARDALGEARATASAELARLADEERRRRAREERAERSRASLERARDAEAEAREALERARRELESTEERRDRAAEALSRAKSAQADSVERLGDALAGFDDAARRLIEEPSAFDAELRDAVSARKTWLAVRRRADAAVTERRPAIEGAAVERREASRAADKAKEAAARVAEALEAERARRREVLGGASADDAEARALSAVEAAREAAAEAGERLRLAHRDDAEASARVERAEVARIEARVSLKELEAALADALEEAGLDREAALARLKRDPAEMEAFRAELRRLDALRAEQTTVLAERERRRRMHEETEPPRLSADDASTALSEGRARLAEMRELHVAVRTRLERDADHRKEAAGLRQQMADQYDRLEVWTMLNDLIGSANGNKLRVFAQSLTLELLLEHANHHLRDLAPRYGLSRVPGEDLALQVVDHEMGDEVRAVTSLSGGESFLVALGLALGLASLSSQQARVDSLFIDEGFGALDPASLEMVLSTLDALQATGRQVGLISHVPAVAERFDTRVQVVAAGPARSRVELVDRAHALF